MSIPATVEELLRTHNVQYGVTELHPSSFQNPQTDASAIRSLIVVGGKGAMQVLYPADCLVDIEGLRQLSGEPVRAASAADIEKLCGSRGFKAPPALPTALGIPALVDRRVLENAELLVASGDGENVISLSNKAFEQLLRDAVVGSFTQPLAELDSGRLDAVQDIEAIKTAVANFTQLRIKARLEETLELPPLPDTAQRIIKLRVDPYADIKDLTDIVETDPPLAAQVVSWAASPYYAAPGKIKSVHDAIVRVLGFDLVLNLSLGLALGKTLSLPKDTPQGFTPYWQQAVYAATSVEALVSSMPVERRPTMGLAYLGGLLHNFGYLLLAQVFPPQFSAYCRLQEANPHTNHVHIERHLLGVTREQLGGWLMRHWQMPEEVSVALRFQNEPDYADEHSVYANVLFVAMRLLREHGIGDAPLEPVPEAVYARLQLEPEKAREVVAGVVEAGEQLRAIAANMMAA